MKFWLSKNSGISLREQISRQVVLAIVGGDLRGGDKLPSVREMALRFRVHPNTVSQAYLWLQKDGWIVSRRGSGVFVKNQAAREIKDLATNPEVGLDALISEFLQNAQTLGFSREQVRLRLDARLKQSQIKKILLIEPETELRKILVCEIQRAIDLTVLGAASINFAEEKNLLIAALEETGKKIITDLPKIILRLNSVQNELRGKERPPSNQFIGVASRWETFLNWSLTMLVATGISSEQIILRDARLPDWKRGLSSCKFVIADDLIADELAEHGSVRVFRLLAEESIIELQNLVG